MNYPLMPVHSNLMFRRQGRIIPGLNMRGGNLVSDVGRSAMNIFASNNKKQAALNELQKFNFNAKTK